jgi:PAS domain S-box-containing protein
MDPLGKVTFFNKFAQRFFGYSEGEIIGKNVVGTIVPEVESTGHDLAHLPQLKNLEDVISISYDKIQAIFFTTFSILLGLLGSGIFIL